MGSGKFTKLFRRYFISYMIILILPLLSGLVSYYYFMDTAEEHSIDESRQALQESMNTIEQRLTEVERFGRQMAMNSEVATLMNRNVTDEMTLVNSFRELSNEISPFTQTSDFLENFYVYFHNSDLIVAPNTVLFRPELFYEFNHYENIEYDDWKTMILQPQSTIVPSGDYLLGDNYTKVITYVQPLPLNSYPDPSGAIVVPIEQQKVNEVLGSISTQFQGWAYVMNEEEQLLAASGIEEEDIASVNIDGDKDNSVQRLDDGTLLIKQTSDNRNWTYVAGIPETYIENQAQPIKIVAWSVTGISLIIGLLICLIFAYRHSKPVAGLVNVLKDQLDFEKKMKPANEFDFLHSNISSLISKNSSLQKQVEKQQPMLKDTLCRQLISGKLNRAKGSMESFAQQAGVNLKGKCGYIAIVKIQGYGEVVNQEIIEELTAARVIIRQESELLLDEPLFTDIHSDKLAYIFLCDDSEKSVSENLEAFFAEIVGIMYEKYRISLKIGIGNFFSDFKHISRSYDEAKQTLDYTPVDQQDGIYWYEDIGKTSSVFYYPLDYEVRFLKAIKEGEEEEAKRTLHDIFVENFEKRALSNEMKRQLVHELRGTFLKSVDQLILEQDQRSSKVLEQLTGIDPEESMSYIKQQLNSCLEEYCKLINDRKKNATYSEVQIIKEFLAEHFGNPDLTIYSIAEHVGRPEKYVSQIFHEETNEYLSDYLENLRIEAAKHLLTTTSEKIADISDNVGYNSPHSFRRAFKRVVEVTPNQYRVTTNN